MQMNHPNILDIILLLFTGLTTVYLIWRSWQRWSWEKAVYVWYYIMSFAVLFVSGVLLIFMGYGILGTPFVLTVASLIPLGISMGIAEQYYPLWKKYFKWFATIGFLAIAVSSFAGWDLVRKISVPVFHGVAGLVIFLGPFFVNRFKQAKKAAKGFEWVGVGGLLIGIGGIALAFLSVGKPLLGIFTADLVFNILSAILFLMTMAFAWGFVKDIKN
jgi:hypothetical protein